MKGDKYCLKKKSNTNKMQKRKTAKTKRLIISKHRFLQEKSFLVLNL